MINKVTWAKFVRNNTLIDSTLSKKKTTQSKPHQNPQETSANA